jgi:hypothetical protein
MWTSALRVDIHFVYNVRDIRSTGNYSPRIMNPWFYIALGVYLSGTSFCGLMLWIDTEHTKATIFDWLTVIFWPLILSWSVITFIYSELKR